MQGRTVGELAELVGRHARIDGRHPTAIGALTLYRLSAPSDPVPTVFEPALCLVAGGAEAGHPGR